MKEFKGKIDLCLGKNYQNEGVKFLNFFKFWCQYFIFSFNRLKSFFPFFKPSRKPSLFRILRIREGTEVRRQEVEGEGITGTAEGIMIKMKRLKMFVSQQLKTANHTLLPRSWLFWTG